MPKERANNLKEILLLVFLSVGVFLILAISSSNLIEREFQNPGFYRPTLSVDQSYYLTITAAPSKGPGQEQRGGGEHSSPSPTGTPDPDVSPTASPTEGPDQEN
jgi:hypothetical protein